MKGLILIFVLLSGISSAIAQEKLWLTRITNGRTTPSRQSSMLLFPR